jgi:hypothetical protein
VGSGKLGIWVSGQRVAQKKETLKPEREAKLEAVGLFGMASFTARQSFKKVVPIL